MTEEEALSKSSGYYNVDGLIGYLPFEAANCLVGTGHYSFEACCCWGYVCRKRKQSG